jgi:hypothetical protein
VPGPPQQAPLPHSWVGTARFKQGWTG